MDGHKRVAHSVVAMVVAMALLMADTTVCEVVGRLDDYTAVNSDVVKDFSLVV